MSLAMDLPDQQVRLFEEADSQHINLGDAELSEYKNVFSKAESTHYFDNLRNNINWQEASIRIAGRQIAIPRLQCWVADPGLCYRYSGLSMEPQQWSQTLRQIRARVERLADHSFNAVLLNYYRDGRDSVAWHADDEPELGSDPVVASVSFGVSRLFELKHRRQNTRLRLILEDGSVLVMGKTLQNNWLHQLPKARTITEPRINLTFRRIVSRGQG